MNKLQLVSLYATYNNSVEIINELNKILNELKQKNREVFTLIAGDFNARNPAWGDEVTNSRGGYLLNWINNKSIEYKINFYPPSEPTYPHTKSFLDIALIDDRIEILNLTLCL